MKRFVLSAVVLASVAARAELVDRVAAVVNRDIITYSELMERAGPELQRLAAEPNKEKRNTLREQILKAALDSLIGERLMEAQVKELNLDVPEAEIDLAIEDVKKGNNLDDAGFERLLMSEGYSMTTYRGFMKKHLAKMKLVNLKVRSKVKVSDEDLRAEYAKVVHSESSDAEVHARHLVVNVDQKATAEQVEAARQKALGLAAEARKPGVDFATLAKNKSEGPSASEGGDLGFFRRGVMVAEFEKAAFSLPEGGVSEPIRTKFGWHVIKVEERRAVAARPFEDMKDQLREKMLRGQLERYTDQYVQELRANALVDDKMFGTPVVAIDTSGTAKPLTTKPSGPSDDFQPSPLDTSPPSQSGKKPKGHQ